MAPHRARRRLIPLGVGGAIAAAAAAVLLLRPDGGAPRSNAASGAAKTPAPTATPARPAYRVVRTIPRVGHRPNGIAVAGGIVWVTSDERDTVERIDASSGRRLKPVHIGRGAAAIVTDGRSVWIATKDAREVVRIDARKGRVAKRIKPGGAPFKLALGFGSLWVGVTTGYGNTALVRYGLHDGEERSRWRLRRGLAGLTTVAGSVWVVERERPQRLMRIDPRTGEQQPWTQLPAPASQLVNDGNDAVGDARRRRHGRPRADPDAQAGHHLRGALARDRRRGRRAGVRRQQHRSHRGRARPEDRRSRPARRSRSPPTRSRSRPTTTRCGSPASARTP